MRFNLPVQMFMNVCLQQPAACGRSVHLKKDFIHIFLVIYVQGKAPTTFSLEGFIHDSGEKKKKVLKAFNMTSACRHVQSLEAKIEVNNLNRKLQ